MQPLRYATSIFMMIVLVCPSLWAQDAVILTPPDLSHYLDSALDRAQADALKEQKRTGGALLVAGGALVATSMASTVIGNDYTTGAAPGIFLAAGSVFSLGGLILLFRQAPHTDEINAYKNLAQWKLDDVVMKVNVGQDILNQEAIVAERERWWGGLLTVLAGSTNLILGFTANGANTNREAMHSAGYFFGGLGYLDMLYEGRLWSGGSIAALGMSNLTVYHTDLYSPSSDYLFISGSLVAASGILRLIKKINAENELSLFHDYIKGTPLAQFAPEPFFAPTPQGLIAGVRGTF